MRFSIIPRGRIRTHKFTEQWQELQKLCRNKETWPQAITLADKLVDSALRKRRFKGKTTGERLVAAQKTLSNNDAVWSSHNLAKKIASNMELKLREDDVKKALLGFGQALKDLEVFPSQTTAKDNS